MAIKIVNKEKLSESVLMKVNVIVENARSGNWDEYRIRRIDREVRQMRNEKVEAGLRKSDRDAHEIIIHSHL